MLAVVAILLLAMPVLGGAIGFHLFKLAGGVSGAAAGLLLALAVVGVPFALLVGAEKRKARQPPPPPPDVPWA